MRNTKRTQRLKLLNFKEKGESFLILNMVKKKKKVAKLNITIHFLKCKMTKTIMDVHREIHS